LPDGTLTGYTSSNGPRPAGNRTPGGVSPGNHHGKPAMAEGTIKKLTTKGFGFIKGEDEEELFFHSSGVQGVSFNDLREGQKVSYTVGQGPKGPRAENVKPI